LVAVDGILACCQKLLLLFRGVGADHHLVYIMYSTGQSGGSAGINETPMFLMRF
jgi:hypothetical protein